MAVEWIWLGLFIWLAFTSEAITGFGSIVIAIALGSRFFSIPELLPILVPLSVLMSSTLLIKFYRDIHIHLLLYRILPFISVGMVAGILLVTILSTDLLKLLFAGLMIWFAGRELYKLHRDLIIRPKPTWWQPLWTFFAGITHGMFASGGPLLVYSLNGQYLSKSQFRATLVSVWFGLNVSYVAYMLQQGKIQPVLPQIMSYVPVLAFAFFCGHWLHKRVSERQFKQIVYWLLFFSALVMGSEQVL